MNVGISLNMLTKEGRSDASVFAEHLTLGDLAEPLGFDSVFALEHHFTGYAMSPSPTQLLSYIAGRTKRITLGTAVIVLPWHDPVRVAEQIALLDILSHGRCVFGFGRGAATVEYAGFRVPMEEARPRFVEAAQIVIKALTQDVFEWDGEFYKIPPMSIRPRPVSHPERRFYAWSVRPTTASSRSPSCRSLPVSTIWSASSATAECRTKRRSSTCACSPPASCPCSSATGDSRRRRTAAGHRPSGSVGQRASSHRPDSRSTPLVQLAGGGPTLPPRHSPRNNSTSR